MIVICSSIIKRQFDIVYGLRLSALTSDRSLSRFIRRERRPRGRHMKAKLARRKFLRLAAGVAALPAISRVARAQTYPNKPVRLIIGLPPGGGADIVARLIAQWLSERLGQQFVVENRPGAGTNIATEAVVRSPPDGYTLLLVNITNAINATLYDKRNFNLVRDIAPVASVNREINAMVVNPSLPAKTVFELIAHAKAHPGTINMASGGNGTPGHIAGELFKMKAGVDMVHVPYRGAAPALIDLISGQVQVMFSNLASSIEYIRAGKLRPLAVTTASRAEVLPNVPTVADFVSGFEASGWSGIGVPRNTPVELVDKLNKEINAGLGNARVKSRLHDLGLTVLASSSADFGQLIADEIEKWAKVIKFAGIKAE